MTWKIEFYNKTVETNIREWPDGMMPKFLWLLHFIENVGPDKIGQPFVKTLGQGLFQITAKGHINTGCALFCISEKKKVVIILDGFVETDQGINPAAIELARAHMSEMDLA
jgi:hypothetical protein